MCRIVAYFGPPVRLSSVLLEPEHSLLEQSHSAREMTDSYVAGDGWGVGWFAEGGGAPGLLKSILPMWSCENAKTAPPAINSGSFVGHVRLASPNVETCFTNTPLFDFGGHLFTMNGELSPWPGALSRALRALLHGEDEASLRGSTDAEMLGALWHTCFRRGRRHDAGAALREALALATDAAREQGGSIKANLIVAGAGGFVATRYADSGDPNSLYTLAEQDRWPGARLVASEPLDDGRGWKRVPPATLVRADAGGLRLEPLSPDESKARHRSA